ncbi:hypothetical protein R1flu_021081 [Riccia fluitans]|uniref:MYND-type domain-containing protein n=1 Tax=Riccia fluitans TaxID=41844 RepID=A0ABD1ZNJ9_9MARC
MRTRRGNYPSASDGITFSIRAPLQKRRRTCTSREDDTERPQKISRTERFSSEFDLLHDDLVLNILTAVSSTANSPADVINTMLTCRRFCALATHKLVLASAAPSALTVKASKWSDGAHRFLKQCAHAGNVEACYTIGMVKFYCMNKKGGGASYMAKAAMQSHAPALHSLAVIQFNGSGGTRKDKDLKAGVALCARAAALGHVDAMRELGHCLQDGYGVPMNVAEGRRLLLEANAREAAASVAASPRCFIETALQAAAGSSSGGAGCLHHHVIYQSVLQNSKGGGGDVGRSVFGQQLFNARFIEEYLGRSSVHRLFQGGGCSLLSDFGCNVPPAKLHIANRFLVDWFNLYPPEAGLRLCSHANCGRPETRRHEFRRCSACGSVNYCSRACQALDWKIRHKYDCSPVADWEEREDAEEEEQAAEEDMDDS